MAAEFRLETKRLRMRMARMSDVADTLAMLSDPVHMRYYPHPFSAEEARNWVRWQLRNYRTLGYGLWVVELKETGEFVGQVGLTNQLVNHDLHVEVGWHTKRSFWGSGYAVEAGAASRDWAFRNLDIDRLISLIRPVNTQSARVAQKLGMRVWEHITKAGFPHDVYSMTRSEWAGLSTSPRS
jgi:RimJ/RimL family protein N-acetyltransferase